MMRKFIAIFGAAIVACASFASPKDIIKTQALTTGTAFTNTYYGLVGYVHEINVSVSDGSSTGTVEVAAVPKDGITSAVNLATNSVVGSKVWYPAIDKTGVDGAALSSDPPGRFLLVGDGLRWIVTGSPTNTLLTKHGN
jgi:hypothetical protein